MGLQVVGYIPDSEIYLLVDADVPLDATPRPETLAWMLERVEIGHAILYEPALLHSITDGCQSFEEPEEDTPAVEELLAGVVEIRGPPKDSLGELATDPGGTQGQEEHFPVVDLQASSEVDWLREAREERNTTDEQ